MVQEKMNEDKILYIRDRRSNFTHWARNALEAPSVNKLATSEKDVFMLVQVVEFKDWI